MFFIECPFCRETRAEAEFSCAGEAFIERPLNPEDIDDQSWADYLFNRTNIKGIFWEQWSHIHGCRQFFVIKRNTVTNEILGSYTLADGMRLIKGNIDKKPVRRKPSARRKATKKG